MAMIFPVVMSSCSRELTGEDAPGTPDGTPVCFSAAAGNVPDTRTDVSAGDDGLVDIVWSEEDAVGMYCIVEGRPSGSNVEYVATPGDNPSECTFAAVDPSEMFVWRTNIEQGYYAYYPYNDDEAVNYVAEAHPLSLPSQQVQDGGNSPARLSDYLFMTAMQEFSADEAAGGNVRYVFRSIYSIVEFRLKMDASLSIEEVPVKSAKLVSTSADLAWPQASIDLTQEIAEDGSMPVDVLSGSREVTLDITGNAGLVDEGYTSIYFAVAPGTHQANSLKLELTAIDNSVYTVDIADGVTFLPNRHYVREYELTLDGFIPAETFDVDIPELTCSVGEPLTMTTEGNAETIEIWTGEEGHDWEYSDKDRMQEPVMTVNFLMNLNSGTQRHPAKIKYSHDFSGEMTEDAILAATWTDVSDEFDFSTYIYGTDEKQTITSESTIPPRDAGIVDCTGWFDEDNRSCYIAFFYHVDEFDADYTDPETGTPGNGRTYFYIYDMWVRAQYPSEETFEELYRHKWSKDESERDETYPNFVQGATFDSSDGTNPLNMYSFVNGQYPMVVRLGSTFRPTTERNSYFVLPELEKPEPKNVGNDTPVLLKDSTDEMQTSYSYTFTSPGTYRIVVVGTVMTLTGENEVVKEFEVTVN